MKLVKKISRKEVKRAFVIAQLIRARKGKKRYLGLLSPAEFEKKLTQAKKKALAMTEKQLDKIISDEYFKRLNAYDASDWFIAEVATREIGVWKRAGGLPLEWTNGSLKETAEKVKKGIETKSKLVNARARRTIPNILKTNTESLQSEKYLYPILFSDGTGTNGRRGLKKRMKADIDDGCMRSISLAIAGKKALRGYVGFPKEKQT
jgi:hypothetical protein